MSMLPPDDDFYEHENMPDDFYEQNENLFENAQQAQEVWNDLSDYFTGDTGFSHDQWMDMNFTIDNVWQDEDTGEWHYDFYWESPDGQYSGSGHR